MKITRFALFAATIVALPAFAQSPPKADVAPFEEPPTLRASEILKPEYLAGSHHKVRDAVPTYAGANWFTIDSDFGVFEAEGNALLEQRVQEIYAIARLKEISRTDEFGKAVARAAKSPVLAAKSLITQPAKTVSAVPKGLFKMLNRAGQGVKDAASGRETSGYEDKRASELVGVSKVKRELAVSLAVDPYSSNETLQRELNSIAWASFAGESTVGALTMAASGGAAAALTAAGVIDRNKDRLRESSPADLRRDNLALLEKMGVPRADTDALLNNAAFSPWHQTEFVSELAELDGVAGRGDFVRAAAEVSEDESDAIFCAQTAALMRRIHGAGTKLDRIVIRNGYPVAIAADGRIIVALQWDYAAWTPRAAGFLDEMEKLAAQGGKPARIHVVLTGQVSPTLRGQLEARGVSVQDRVVPGPLQ